MISAGPAFERSKRLRAGGRRRAGRENPFPVMFTALQSVRLVAVFRTGTARHFGLLFPAMPKTNGPGIEQRLQMSIPVGWEPEASRISCTTGCIQEGFDPILPLPLQGVKI